MKLISEIIKKNGITPGTNYIVLIGLTGIIMLTASEFMPKTKEKSVETSYYEIYQANTEKQLKNILSSISGAGRVEVMLTLASGQETIYAQQEKSTQDKQDVLGEKTDQQSFRHTFENEIVMVEENNQKQALVEKVLEPVVQGVVVVCEGADDISVVSDITNAVCVALDVTSNRVCVIKMK